MRHDVDWARDACPDPVLVRTSWPRHENDEIAAVAAVLASGRVNSLQHGDQTRAFEAEFAARMGASHGLAVANGTVALEIALEALGVGPGDEVIVTPRSFFASVSCVRRVGAEPVFADVDPESQNITPSTVAKVLGPRTKAIVPVHFAGWPCDMDGIMALARAKGLLVIEDCAQAHGASWHGRPVGSYGDAAAFSFCTDKIMSTGGEGGMVLFSSAAAYAEAWSIKDHGKDLEETRRPASVPVFRWLHRRIGTNARMTEMQAAIGRCQLRKMDRWVKQRRANAAVLDEALTGIAALRIPVLPVHAGNACYRWYCFVEPRALRPGWDRDRIVRELTELKVPVFSGSCAEVYRESAFAGTRWAPAQRLPSARLIGETSLAFLVDQTMDGAAMWAVAAAVKHVLARAAH